MSSPNLLASLVTARNWTADDGVRHYQAAAEELGEGSAISTRQWNRWCSGELKQPPRAASRRVLERMFRRTVSELFAPTASGESVSPPLGGVDLATAVEDATRLLSQVESASLGPATLEQLGDDVTQLARRYTTTQPAEIVRTAIRLQHKVQNLIEKTSRPNQQTDLYLFLGQLSGLLAIAGFDLGDTTAASTFARTAWGYGEHIGHDSLRAWARSTHALIAYWSGRADEAVKLAQSAHQYQPRGTGLVRTWYIQARSHAHARDRISAERALRAAWDARNDIHADPLHDGVGGEFGYSTARAARCEGSMWIQLGQGDLAIERASEAITLFSTESNLKVTPQAHVDLAAGLLLNHDLAGAAEQLTPIFDVPVAHRVTGLNERLRTVQTILARTNPKGPLAATLRSEISEFVKVPAGQRIEPAAPRRSINP